MMMALVCVGVTSCGGDDDDNALQQLQDVQLQPDAQQRQVFLRLLERGGDDDDVLHIQVQQPQGDDDVCHDDGGELLQHDGEDNDDDAVQKRNLCK